MTVHPRALISPPFPLLPLMGPGSTRQPLFNEHLQVERHTELHSYYMRGSVRGISSFSLLWPENKTWIAHGNRAIYLKIVLACMFCFNLADDVVVDELPTKFARLAVLAVSHSQTPLVVLRTPKAALHKPTTLLHTYCKQKSLRRQSRS